MQKINTVNYEEKLKEYNEIINDLKISEDEIEKGKTVPAEIVFKELREKYEY